MRIVNPYWTALAMMALCGSLPAFAADTYDIDPVHSAYLFKVKHLGVSYSYGRFNESSGTFALDAENPANNRIEIEVKTDSIDTDNKDRDKHLRSADFFNTAEYPTMTFTSTSFKKVDDNHFEVTGDLTIHGVTKSVSVTAELVGIAADPKGDTRAGLQTVITINRTEFGMDKMVGPVGAEVELTISVEGIRQ
jgi:polyisoprenoid-binding protein YceI